MCRRGRYIEMIALSRVGLWTRQLDAHPGAVAAHAAAELEGLGYRTLWIPEAQHREVLSHATLLLAATQTITIATGVARVHARSPQASALAERFLNERFPGRFILGLGVSHPLVVERVLGQVYGSPMATMRAYLDAMDATSGGSPVPAGSGHGLAAGSGNGLAAGSGRVLAALGPRMLALAAERTAGAHTYMAPVAHTRLARRIVGPDALVAPVIKAVLTGDMAAGRAISRWSLQPALTLPAYRANVLRSGFTADDLDSGLSDRVVDALVAIGDDQSIATRVREHLDAGADHVCVEVLTGDDTSLPMDAWRRLAAALTELD
jgi:probable F420-dependent oxidoreductase